MLSYEHPLDQHIIATVIQSGSAFSQPVQAFRLGGFRGLGVAVPNAWTSANLAFQANLNGTWTYLYDQNGDLAQIENIAIAEARIYSAPPEVWTLGVFDQIRLVSHSGTAVIPQTGSRTLYAILLK